MSSLKLFAKSRTISLLIGLVILTLVLPGVVSAKTISSSVNYATGDRPIAGDWNGDGQDEAGVYRPGIGFYLKMDNGNTWNPSTDRFLSWDNAAGDLPIAGDWNRDGRAETGVYRPGVGFYLKMNNGNTWNPSTDRFLAWDNAAGDLPIAGDWNGDGRAETGVYRPGVGFYLKMNNGRTWNPSTDRFLAWDNTAGVLPIAGDWNEDGRTELGDVTSGNVRYFDTNGRILSELTSSDSEETNYIMVSSLLSGGECYGAEACNPTGSPIGGGAGYMRVVSETDASVKYVVSTKDQLITALKSAKSGEIVFVKGTATIDLTYTPGLTIPAGVTLASDRGKDGSPGALIYRTVRSNDEHTFIAGGNNVRVTGLRIRGSDTVEMDSISDVKCAIKAVERTMTEVDNCEIWYWSYAGIAQEGGTGYYHHNYIHHNHPDGYGYGVVTGGGNSIIEANIFDYNRHSISAPGLPGEGYEARYNIERGHGTAYGGWHHFDVHAYPTDGQSSSIAGNLYKIHHNTFETTEVECIGIRATPTTGIYIDHNVFNVPPGRPVFKKSYNGNSLRMFVTSNFWNGVLYKSDEIVDYKYG